MRKTLQDIAGKLNQESIPWVLAGKTAAVLQGAIINAKKLTFYTTQHGSYKFGEFFNQFKVERVKYRENTPLTGHAGRFIINEIDIGIVGDPEVVYQRRKYPLPLQDITNSLDVSEIGGMEVPLMPLPWLFVLGIMGNDQLLIEAVADCGLEKTEVKSITDNLGISFYIAAEVEKYLS